MCFNSQSFTVVSGFLKTTHHLYVISDDNMWNMRRSLIKELQTSAAVGRLHDNQKK